MATPEDDQPIAHRHCPERTPIGHVVNTLRLAKHVALRLASRPRQVLYADIIAADALSVQLRPWGWRSPLVVPLADVVAAIPSSVGSYERTQLIAREQRALEGTWSL